MSKLSRRQPKRRRPFIPLAIVYRDPKQLKKNPHNARTHSEKQRAQIERSIYIHGFTNPLLIDEHDGIIAGHGRHSAAIAMGLKTVPTITLRGLSEAQRRGYALADNKLALNAGWDIQILTGELKFLSDPKLDFDVASIGFDTVEIDSLIAAATAPNSRDDSCPALSREKATSRLGDIWVLGGHRVICGDATNAETYAALLGNELARMAFLDAPYNVKIDGHVSGLGRKRHREFLQASGEMTSGAFTKFLIAVFTLCAKHCIDGAILFECMDWRHLREVIDAGITSNLELKNLIVWSKTNAGMGTFYRSGHELIFAYKCGRGRHVNNFGLGEGGRYRTNVWEYPGCNSFGRARAAELDSHPTPKPVAMIADAIRDVSRHGDIVLDCFGGSGSTLIAAEKTGRRARLIELDPLYVDVIVRRWEVFTGLKATHAQSRKTFTATVAERSAS
jgi:DNA modification methylase